MRRIVIPFLVGTLLLTLQATLLMSSPIQRIRPDILLIFTLYLGFTYPPVLGGILAFFMGYLMDLFSANSFGLYTFSRPLLFYGAQFFKDRFYLESVPSQFLFVLSFSLSEGLLIFLLLAALNPNSLGNLYPLILNFFIPQSVFTGLVTPILFFIFNQGYLLLFRRPGIETKERG